VAIKIHALAYRLGKRWQSTAPAQKIIALAMLAWDYFLCPGAVVATYT